MHAQRHWPPRNPQAATHVVVFSEENGFLHVFFVIFERAALRLRLRCRLGVNGNYITEGWSRLAICIIIYAEQKKSALFIRRRH